MKYEKGDLVLLQDGLSDYGVVLILGKAEQSGQQPSSLYRWVYKFIMLKEQKEDWHYQAFVEQHGVKVG
jgi:hypothetical protein